MDVHAGESFKIQTHQPPLQVNSSPILYGNTNKAYCSLTVVFISYQPSCIGRISARGFHCYTDLGVLGPYEKDREPIFSQYIPSAWFKSDIYTTGE